MKTIKWIIVNGIMLYLLCLGLFDVTIWAQNIIKFMIWLNFILNILLVFNEEVREELKKSARPVPQSVHIVYGFIFAGVLASQGWFGYASIDMATTIIQLIFYSNQKKDLK